MRAADLTGLDGQDVVVTEKLDGENTTLYRDGLHARSLDSAHHPSRAWLKALHARIAARIPEGYRVCGENVFARHSIAYRALESWFYAFSVWDGDGRCLDWDATTRFAGDLGVPLPAALFRGSRRIGCALPDADLDLVVALPGPVGGRSGDGELGRGRRGPDVAVTAPPLQPPTNGGDGQAKMASRFRSIQ